MWRTLSEDHATFGEADDPGAIVRRRACSSKEEESPPPEGADAGRTSPLKIERTRIALAKSANPVIAVRPIRGRIHPNPRPSHMPPKRPVANSSTGHSPNDFTVRLGAR